MKNMRTRMLVALVVAAGFVGVAAAPSQAASQCTVAGNNASITCWSTSTVSKTTAVVESVPLKNTSSKTATFHCTFSKSLSYTGAITTTAGASVSASVKAAIFASVDASVSYSVSLSLSQTAAQATEAGVTVSLKPGQSVVCERTYTKVTATVTETYTNTKTTTTTYKAVLPSSFGVTLAD